MKQDNGSKFSSDNYVLHETEHSIDISFIGDISYQSGDQYDKILNINGLLKTQKRVAIDFSKLKTYDSYLVVFLDSACKTAKQNGVDLKVTGMNDELNGLVNLLTPKAQAVIKEKEPSLFVRYFENIGVIIAGLLRDFYDFMEFLGDLAKKLALLPFNFRQARWKDFPFHLTKAGINAIPIVMLIVFLIGLITSYQGAVQLKIFGADIYIANLVGYSITRELAPLMAAIIVAGRSGSAFAAEIGTMKVAEEVDALNTIGFDRIYFLVIPRVLAVAISLPILVLMADFVGIGGGILAALSVLDITLSGFLIQLKATLFVFDIVGGMFKAFIFGILIAAVGCFRGFQVQGGAESVGRFTTASVVTGIFLVIIVDAVLLFLFQAIGI